MRRAIEDPVGAAWQAEANRRWAVAMEESARTGVAAASIYRAPAFPEWPKPMFVTREIMGRYAVDRDARVVHDLATAEPDCRIDAIANATWVHFGHEVPDDLDLCERCFAEETDGRRVAYDTAAVTAFAKEL